LATLCCLPGFRFNSPQFALASLIIGGRRRLAILLLDVPFRIFNEFRVGGIGRGRR
jgi:hypothetical protein